tara:strand:+ start:12418 stop:12780 length:363 start_codon:yes stop_codon:yes gene_type:complete
MEKNINLVDDAVEKIDIDFKAMIEEIKDVASVYVVDRKSARFVIRKLGYNSFTVVYTYDKATEVWSVCGYDSTPERVQIYIDNWGEQQETEKEFYLASHAYSWQEHGFYSKNYFKIISGE